MTPPIAARRRSTPVPSARRDTDAGEEQWLAVARAPHQKNGQTQRSTLCEKNVNAIQPRAGDSNGQRTDRL